MKEYLPWKECTLGAILWTGLTFLMASVFITGTFLINLFLRKATYSPIEAIYVGGIAGILLGCTLGSAYGAIRIASKRYLSRLQRGLVGSLYGGLFSLPGGLLIRSLFWGQDDGGQETFLNSDLLFIMGGLLIFGVFVGFIVGVSQTSYERAMQKQHNASPKSQEVHEQIRCQAKYEKAVEIASKLRGALDEDTICQITGISKDDLSHL